MRHEAVQVADQTVFSPGERWTVGGTLSSPKASWASGNG